MLQNVCGMFADMMRVLRIYTVSKNVPPLVCYNFDIREHILIFFGRNLTHKVSNQKTLYYATPNNLCFCTTWQNGKTRKSHFSLKCCISASTEFNSSLLDFFSLFDSGLVLTLLYDSLNLVINARGCWGHGSGEKKSRAPQPLDCVARTMHMHQCAVFPKNVICDVFDSVWHLLR